MAATRLLLPLHIRQAWKVPYGFWSVAVQAAFEDAKPSFHAAVVAGQPHGYTSGQSQPQAYAPGRQQVYRPAGQPRAKTYSIAAAPAAAPAAAADAVPTAARGAHIRTGSSERVVMDEHVAVDERMAVEQTVEVGEEPATSAYKMTPTSTKKVTAPADLRAQIAGRKQGTSNNRASGQFIHDQCR